jgi:hypothetical protein
MAQTGYTPISIYYSSTASAAPTAGNLVAGELAINTADGKLFYKDSAGVVQVIGTKGGVGSSTTTQVLYNSSGLVVGSANMTFSGTALTLANDASISGLTVGKGGGAVNGNTAVGASALAANTSATETTAFGSEALKVNTTGSSNTALGERTLKANTTGGSNTAVGSASLISNTTGVENVSVGRLSMILNTTGNYNTAVGKDSLYSNTTASYNTAVGYQSGYSSTTADYNTFIGYYAGRSTTGDQNTFIGKFAGNAVTTGTLNAIIGAYNGNQGGLDIRTASNWIVLSDGGGTPRFSINGSSEATLWNNGTGGTGALWIGRNSTIANAKLEVTGSDNMMVSNNTDTGSGGKNVLYILRNSSNVGSIQCTNTATSFNTSSDYRLKDNIAPMTGALAKVSALNPVTYKWKLDGSDAQGFIAHELAEVCPDAVSGEKDAVDAEGKPVYQAIDTSFLVATLTAAIQELKAEFDAYKATHP